MSLTNTQTSNIEDVAIENNRLLKQVLQELKELREVYDRRHLEATRNDNLADARGRFPE